MLFSLLVMLICCGAWVNTTMADWANFMVTLEFSLVNYTWGNAECPNTNHSALDDVCLFSTISLQCTLNGSSSLDVEWTLYPHNTTINSSNVIINNETSSTMYNVSAHESVFFLVTHTGDPTNCPLCNISLDTSHSSSALIVATESYCK